MKQMKSFYSKLRIKYKMFLLISFILLSFSIGGISILQHAFNVYNEEIYRQSAQSLGVSSNSIENELKKMERLSFQVATDSHIQSYLKRLKDNQSEYEKYIVENDIKDRLLQLGALNKYVDSLQVYDLSGKEYATGKDIEILSKDRIQEVDAKASVKKGGVEWVFPNREDPALITARKIRSYSDYDFSFEPLGLVAVRMNVAEVVSDFTSTINGENAQLAIFDENNQQVYPVDTRLSSAYTAAINNEKGYSLIKDNRERYFITYSPAQHTKWTYMIVTPYSSLFNAITSVRAAVISLYTIMFIVVAYMSMRFVNGIIKPIEGLNKKMEIVQTGELDPFYSNEDVKYYRDETGKMHENFNIMMNQINHLIAENYKKQLVIKEAEFKTLQAQVNPHFLYNTLESINWSAKMEGKDRISRMAESLGYILQSSINMKESTITLEKEMTIVEKYIVIQSYRFEERLDFQTEISEELYHCMVPKFTLQPLIENAIRYGLQQMVGTCTIRVIGKKVKDNIILTVEDNGPGMDADFLPKLKNGDYQPQGTGIGLRNIDERIQMIFGKKYGIKIESTKVKGTKVYVMLPYEGGGENVQRVVSR
ncbi:cache domain-containing sensor histidine kinase [Aquibacillus albus]|uniref:histidine kinase n=1 Tax=Aquibacillus albus TaxID=1168171 RepID=A0ABS2MYQ2_9BACI|nr:sensor histidine kinase [Aquibacillus albus]MBM7571026.1 two-component system sensor histidine kinase YesM [Aquibacillus albus]